MTVCIQCALEAFVAGLPPLAPFDETPAEHRARVHPNGVDPAVRADLERRAAEMIARLQNPSNGGSER